MCCALGVGNVSKAKTAFLANVADVDRLLEIHEELTGAAAGRRHKVEVLNKAAIMLISAFWILIAKTCCRKSCLDSSPIALASFPFLKNSNCYCRAMCERNLDERAPWRLAGKGWRREITVLANSVSSDINFLNTPKTRQIDSIFKLHLGIDISKHWSWPGMIVANASRKLVAG